MNANSLSRQADAFCITDSIETAESVLQLQVHAHRSGLALSVLVQEAAAAPRFHSKKGEQTAGYEGHPRYNYTFVPVEERSTKCTVQGNGSAEPGEKRALQQQAYKAMRDLDCFGHKHGECAEWSDTRCLLK